MNTVSLLYHLSAACALVLGVLAISRGRLSNVNRVFFAFCLSIALSAYCLAELADAATAAEATLWVRMISVWAFAVALLAHFVLAFTDQRRLLGSPLTHVVLYLPPLVYLILRQSWLPMPAVLEPWGWAYAREVSGGLSLFFMVWTDALSLLAIWLCVRYYLRMNTKMRRAQALYVLLGTLVPIVAAVLTHVVLPRLGVKVPDLTVYGFAVGTIFYAYAILRYRLFSLTAEVAAESIIATMADALFLVDAEGRILMSNPAAERLLGYTAEELAGRSLETLVTQHAADEGQPRGWREAKDRAKVTSSTEVGLTTKRGAVVPVSLAVSQPAGPAGDDAGFVFIARDMTERRQAEEERRRLEAQLQRSQKLEGLGGLAGRIAHDFNNLFGGIFGYIILGRDAAAAGDAPAALEHLTKTLVVFDRAKRLTQQILTFARGGELARKPIALAGKLRKAAEIASYRTGGACTCDIAPDLGTCEADEQQLGQVLDALLANAQEAAPAGSAIEVRAANAPAGSALPAGLAPGDYVCITIADHGCGIAPEHLSRVFEPFFTTKSGAAGLGLAIAYSVVKKHNGAIEVQSQPGAGTAFSVYLPAARQAPTPAAHPGDAAAPPRSKASGRILVMDDEDFMRDVARGMLTALGYSVETAGDGNEALALHARARAAATPFRAALLDLTVPVGVGGKDAAKRLRAVDRSIVLIASSGYSEDPVMARPAEFGFDAVLAKPYQQDDLARVLQEAFAARQ